MKEALKYAQTAGFNFKDQDTYQQKWMDVVFICFDIERIQDKRKDDEPGPYHGHITNVGVVSLDTRDIIGVHPQHWCTEIKKFDYLIRQTMLQPNLYPHAAVIFSWMFGARTIGPYRSPVISMADLGTTLDRLFLVEDPWSIADTTSGVLSPNNSQLLRIICCRPDRLQGV